MVVGGRGPERTVEPVGDPFLRHCFYFILLYSRVSFFMTEIKDEIGLDWFIENKLKGGKGLK